MGTKSTKGDGGSAVDGSKSPEHDSIGFCDVLVELVCSVSSASDSLYQNVLGLRTLVSTPRSRVALHQQEDHHP